MYNVDPRARILKQNYANYGQASFGTVFGDDADAAGFDGGSDERVDVVVTDFTHQTHLLHRLATDLAPFGEAKVLDTHHSTTVQGNVGEHLVHAVRCYAR